MSHIEPFHLPNAAHPDYLVASAVTFAAVGLRCSLCRHLEIAKSTAKGPDRGRPDLLAVLSYHVRHPLPASDNNY